MTEMHVDGAFGCLCVILDLMGMGKWLVVC